MPEKQIYKNSLGKLYVYTPTPETTNSLEFIMFSIYLFFDSDLAHSGSDKIFMLMSVKISKIFIYNVHYLKLALNPSFRK